MAAGEQVREEAFTRAQCESWLDNPTVNPVTGRKISLEGPTFDRYVRSCLAHGINIEEGIEQRKAMLLEEVRSCNNEEDYINGEPFVDYPLDKLEQVVKLGSGNCFDAESIYGWVKERVESARDPNDPLNPSYILTPEDRRLVYRKRALALGSQDEEEVAYRPPEIMAPEGFQLVFRQLDDEPNILQVGVTNENTGDIIINTLGFVPLEVDESITGSVDFTSAIAQFRLMVLWNNGLIPPLGEEMGIEDLDRSRTNYGHFFAPGARQYGYPLYMVDRERYVRFLDHLNGLYEALPEPNKHLM